MMKEVRCKNCGKLLGYFDGKGEIKCPRMDCGGKNRFDTATEQHDFIPKPHSTPLRERTTSSGVTFR